MSVERKKDCIKMDVPSRGLLSGGGGEVATVDGVAGGSRGRSRRLQTQPEPLYAKLGTKTLIR